MAAAALGAAGLPAGAASLEPVFNEAFIETVRGEAAFDVGDEMATFGAVFGALPEAVKVYPTENYYYFSFYAGGVEYGGNLRLDAADRDDGVLHFAYYRKPQPWTDRAGAHYRQLTAADGVRVERERGLAYRVTYGGKSVVFRLNDLSDVTPPDDAVRAGETFLGPVFDESGLAFYLLFDTGRREFMFVLDERERVADELVRVREEHPALTVGERTGFAFYEDRHARRKILVGVEAGNVALNNYHDGPFDQLPDNFVRGEELREAILAKHPDLQGEIDRFGGFVGSEGRFLVNPYVHYGRRGELEAFLRCADPALDEEGFYRCVTPPARE
ncbi:hypothetical protein N177_0813 [Lutibaculum baratangense AMV1]|uniref:Uncharacterized protein n=1 Tax=Lutibaculum baratangense AMV1 TaxID=631454 RepID=V4RMT5_9HYPH|nr:hypothetical protein N177_0813 [Lutibaculum baratangense AMV1]